MQLTKAPKLLAIFSMVAFLGACQTMQDSPKQTVGTILGAAGGALLGNQIGGGAGRTVAVALGTLAGAYLGSEVGSSLDAADRTAMQRTTQSALETQPSFSASSWSNPDTGNSGEITPTRTYFEGSTPCREYTNTVTIDGRLETVTGTACRQADGTWRIRN